MSEYSKLARATTGDDLLRIVRQALAPYARKDPEHRAVLAEIKRRLLYYEENVWEDHGDDEEGDR